MKYVIELDVVTVNNDLEDNAAMQDAIAEDLRVKNSPGVWNETEDGSTSYYFTYCLVSVVPS